MPRPLKNNPIGISGTPNLVTDPAREAQLVACFQRALVDVLWSFSNARRNEANYETIEQSIARICREVKRKRQRPSKGPQILIHPIVAWRINELAKEAAVERTGDLNAKFDETDVKVAAAKFAATVPVRRGRPADKTLWNHIELLMALMQRAVGEPVMARRSDGSVYRMFLNDQKAKIIFHAIHNIDSKVTEAQVADIIVKLRRRYAGKDMDFHKLACKKLIQAQAAFRDQGFGAKALQGLEVRDFISSIYSP